MRIFIRVSAMIACWSCACGRRLRIGQRKCTAFPELFVELFDHYYAQRLPEAQIAQKKINHFMRVLGQEPSIAQLKSGLELYGLHSGGVRRPFRNLSESEKTTLLQLLRQLTQEFTRG